MRLKFHCRTCDAEVTRDTSVCDTIQRRGKDEESKFVMRCPVCNELLTWYTNGRN